MGQSSQANLKGKLQNLLKVADPRLRNIFHKLRKILDFERKTVKKKNSF